jgi:Ca2+-binding RTX toxin-like protein
VVRQGSFIAVVRAFVIGCAILMVVGCAGMRSEAPQEQDHTVLKPPRTKHTHAQQRPEEARCGRTRTIDLLKGADKVFDYSVQPGDPEARYITNDIPGCPNGGPLSGTDKPDRLAGEDGEDEVRGLGGSDRLAGGRGRDVLNGGPGDDELWGGGEPLAFYTDWGEDELYGGPGRDFLSGDEGDDVIYGGEGDEEVLSGGDGEDVLYGGDGNDYFETRDGVLYDSRDYQRDELYCGEGKDTYLADKLDHVDSSCEVKIDEL